MSRFSLLLLVFIFASCDSVVSLNEAGTVDPSMEGVATKFFEGGIYSWGQNEYGQVSDALTNGSFKAVAAGGSHSLALREDGSLVSWGDNYYGQVSMTPDGTDFVDISAGGYHSLAVRENGTIEAWGPTIFPFGDDWLQVRDAPTDGGYVAVSAGLTHSLALREDGTLEAWSSFVGPAGEPIPGDDFVDISAGGRFNIALRADSTLEVWGYDTFQVVSDAPTGSDFIAISAGGEYGLALREDGTLEAWGNMGDPPSGADFIDVSAGYVHGLAMREDGTIKGWGKDVFGEVSNIPTGKVIAMSAGSHHGVAIEPSRFLVSIDIKRDYLSMNSRGNVPLAILSDSGFDAPNEVDRETLTFGVTGTEESLRVRGNHRYCSTEDSNNNGLDDLVCQFHLGTTGFSEADEEAILLAQTIDGSELEGYGAVSLTAAEPNSRRRGNTR